MFHNSVAEYQIKQIAKDKRQLCYYVRETATKLITLGREFDISAFGSPATGWKEYHIKDYTYYLYNIMFWDLMFNEYSISRAEVNGGIYKYGKYEVKRANYEMCCKFIDHMIGYYSIYRLDDKFAEKIIEADKKREIMLKKLEMEQKIEADKKLEMIIKNLETEKKMIDDNRFIDVLEGLFAKFIEEYKEFTTEERLRIFKIKMERKWKKLEMEEVNGLGWDNDKIREHINTSRKISLEFYNQKLKITT